MQRHWLVLSKIPVLPRRVQVASLVADLRAYGIVVHARTLQRDLVALSQIFPLVCDERCKPYGWSWANAVPELFARGVLGARVRLVVRAADGAVRAIPFTPR